MTENVFTMHPVCQAMHPEHSDVLCYRSEDHTGAHAGTAMNGKGYAWGLGTCAIIARLTHQGQEYVLLDEGQFDCAFLGDRASQGGGVDYHFSCVGLHLGWPLDIWLCDVRLEYDDDGPGSHATWKDVRWADDNAALTDEDFLDGYLDASALLGEVKSMLQAR